MGVGLQRLGATGIMVQGFQQRSRDFLGPRFPPQRFMERSCSPKGTQRYLGQVLQQLLVVAN
jgi:hypothetical protein